ncbi:MAG TPA: hypothetical protein PLE30_08815 [Candidatus Kapabacteria bacterium]|nr:hypothetical protein [Candidatus Kapabacteria bacterium]
MQAKNIALIEICGSHDECLYSQYRFIRESGNNVFFIISDNLASRIKHYDDNLNILSLKFNNKLSNDLLKLLEIKKYLKKKRIDIVVLNTASNEIISKLVYLIPNHIQIIGLLHSLKKLKHSFSQSLINKKVKKMFVLNDYLISHIPSIESINFQSIYTIYFKKPYIEVAKAQDEFWIAIPGNIQFSRRDYLGLIHNLESNDIPPNIKFLFLSSSNAKHSDAHKIKDLIYNKKYKDNFVFFDNYIMPDLMAGYISQSDLILPLLNPGVAHYDDYMKYQISGTFNLSFAFAKPMLIHYDFEKIDDFAVSSFFCNDNHFFEKIFQLYNNRELILDKCQSIAAYKKFDFDKQQANYLNFLYST